jgi:saccharopine dehydrogenase (NAD+, L-lysine-forming)
VLNLSSVGCEIVEKESWRNAPKDAYIVGIKELQDDGKPLVHRHIYFGHAYKVILIE